MQYDGCEKKKMATWFGNVRCGDKDQTQRYNMDVKQGRKKKKD